MGTFLRISIMQCLLGVACLIAVTATQVNADDGDTTTKVSGVVSKIESARISVTMKEGTPITIELNEGGNVIEIRTAG